MIILLLPPTKRIAGRPKKNKSENPSENPRSKTKSLRKGTHVIKSRWKEHVHNKLGCKKTPIEQTRTEPQATGEQVTTQRTP